MMFTLKVLLTLSLIIFTSVSIYSSVCLALDPLMSAVDMSTSALKAQSERIKIISENLANEDSSGTTPGAAPYKRKTIAFNLKKNASGTKQITKLTYKTDNKRPFKKRYEPSHPAADKQGYVLYPNVDKNIEFVDAKEAQRSYDANLNSIEISKSMVNKILETIK